MPPPVLLCDLDDTLIAFGSVAEPAWREICAEHAPSLDVDHEALAGAIREAADAFWADEVRAERARLDLPASRRRIVRSALEMLDLPVGRADAVADAYSDRRDRLVHALPGAIETLGGLRRRGVPLALVTNGSGEAQRVKIERFELEPLFDSVLIEGELGFGKPDPRVFERALAELDASAERAWMVGDNLSADIAGAQALGIRTIWRDVERRGLPPASPVRPDATVREFHEVPALLARMSHGQA